MFPANQIVGQSPAVRAAIRAHYYAARPRPRIIQSPPGIIRAGPIVAFVGYVESTDHHAYHPMANHHDPVLVATELVVLVVFILAAGKLIRVVFSDPFPKELLDGA